jgi:hypothetical protein
MLPTCEEGGEAFISKSHAFKICSIIPSRPSLRPSSG